MWFDSRARLAEIEAQVSTARPVSQVSQRSEAGNPSPRVANVVTPLRKKLEIKPSAFDPEIYLTHLRASGPTSYGAAATALGWGETRTWLAEAHLLAQGLVVYRHGKAEVI
jgi:hypothetical protein